MDKHQYEKAHHNAEQLHNKIKDLVDDPQHHQGREMIELSHRLAQDIKSQKNPRSLENSTKSLISFMERVRGQGDQVMDFQHIDMIVDSYQRMVMDFRKFENY